MDWSQFIALQIEYSLLQRTPERELMPMAKHFGMTVTPWAPLAGGALTSKYLRGDKGRIKDDSNRLNENSWRITKEVIAVAEKIGADAAHVALKWTMQKPLSVMPVVGATKLEQLEQNLKTVDVVIPEEDMKHLDEISAIDLGFPMKFFKEEAVQINTYGGFYDRLKNDNNDNAHKSN